MSDAVRGAMRLGVLATTVAFSMNLFHLPQPFLAVLCTVLIAPFSVGSGWEVMRRWGAVLAGVFFGVGLMVLSAQTYWFSIPLFAVVCGLGGKIFFQRVGMAEGILFVMGIGGMYPAAWIEPSRGIWGGVAHAEALSIAVMANAFWWKVIPAKGKEGKSEDNRDVRPWLVGVVAVMALVLACFVLPRQEVVMEIAALTGILGLEAGGGRGVILRKMGGLFAGVVASVIFVGIVAGSRNDLGVYLVIFGGAFFLWESLAAAGNGVFWRQVAVVFAVCSTMGPGPDAGVNGLVERSLAVFCGFLLSAGLWCLAGDRRKEEKSRAEQCIVTRLTPTIF